eukprot:12606139-Alexandrium_andersonii.AAC.1
MSGKKKPIAISARGAWMRGNLAKHAACQIRREQGGGAASQQTRTRTYEWERHDMAGGLFSLLPAGPS